MLRYLYTCKWKNVGHLNDDFWAQALVALNMVFGLVVAVILAMTKVYIKLLYLEMFQILTIKSVKRPTWTCTQQCVRVSTLRITWKKGPNKHSGNFMLPNSIEYLPYNSLIN